MLKYKKIKTAKGIIEAFLIRLASKSLILLKGKKGYIMCGYLDLKAAQKFGDAAVKITSVSDIAGALEAKVYSLTSQAKRLGISKGEKVKDILCKIA